MASILMRFPEGKCKALTLSYDDGVEQDIRLIEIMKKYGLKGTFNLNAGVYPTEQEFEEKKGSRHRRLTYAQATKLYGESGMEVAIHGYHHPHLTKLPVGVCMNEIVKDREALEKQFQTMVRGAAYPYGLFNDEVTTIMKGAGIVYARTVLNRDNFALPEDWLRWEATCKHTNPRLMELAERFVEKQPPSSPWLFYVWGHSYEFDLDDNWDVIEAFAAYMGGRDDIWYATNLEIYEYTEAYQRLVFSLDGECVYNPTLFDLYFEKNNEMYCVHPGEHRVLRKEIK